MAQDTAGKSPLTALAEELEELAAPLGIRAEDMATMCLNCRVQTEVCRCPLSDRHQTESLISKAHHLCLVGELPWSVLIDSDALSGVRTLRKASVAARTTARDWRI